MEVGDKIVLPLDDLPRGVGGDVEFEVVVIRSAEEDPGKQVGVMGPETMRTGHSCDGHAPEGRGWWVHPDNYLPVVEAP